jgi:hypothetical protein
MLDCISVIYILEVVFVSRWRENCSRIAHGMDLGQLRVR